MPKARIFFGTSGGDRRGAEGFLDDLGGTEGSGGPKGSEKPNQALPLANRHALASLRCMIVLLVHDSVFLLKFR